MGIGAEIARARNAAALTHAELAERTRIRAAIIQAIERDDFTLCGGDVFARGHVKALALALDLDPTPLLEQLGAVQSPTTFAQPEPDKINVWELRDRARTPSEWRSWAILMGISVVVIAAIVAVTRDSTANTELVPANEPSASVSLTPTPEATATVTAEPSATSTPSATSSVKPSVQPTDEPIGESAPTPPQETEAAVVDGAIVLQFDAIASSWIRITNDLGTLFEGTMTAGESKAFASDTDVRVRVGNAAGIQLTYNGRTYSNLGGPGEVYTHTFRVG